MTGDLVATDFAKIGEGYGCKTYSVRTEEELIAALDDAKKQTVSTLIDIKILPKTMTHGYEGFWRCGQAEVAKNPVVTEKTKEMQDELKKARQY